ncbi:MAG: cytochrome c [Bacteroidia bacterium]
MLKLILFCKLIVIFLLMISCNNKQNFTENKEDIISNEEIAAITREDSSETGRVYFTKGEFEGMKLFMHHCNKCHPGGEKGKGPSLNDKKLPDFAIHFQIRNGLGDMPAFKKEDISKDHVKKIILFVRLMRANTN